MKQWIILTLGICLFYSMTGELVYAYEKKKDPLMQSMQHSAAGMHGQSERIRVASENIANANSTGTTPGEDPYRRKLIFMNERFDRELELRLLKITKISGDPTPFPLEYNPSHPAADNRGYVKMPNLDPLIEQADITEASRSYEANIRAYENSKAMINRTIGLLNQ